MSGYGTVNLTVILNILARLKDLKVSRHLQFTCKFECGTCKSPEISWFYKAKFALRPLKNRKSWTGTFFFEALVI